MNADRNYYHLSTPFHHVCTCVNIQNTNRNYTQYSQIINYIRLYFSIHIIIVTVFYVAYFLKFHLVIALIMIIGG